MAGYISKLIPTLTMSIRCSCSISRNCAAAFLIWAISFSFAGAASDSWIPPFLEKSDRHLAPQPVARSGAAGKAFKERLLQVDINLLQLNQTVLVLEDKAGELYVWSHDLQRWNFRPPDAGAAIEYQGEKFYPLSAVSDVSHVYNRKELTLMIEVRPGAFVETRLAMGSENISLPVKPKPGGFINYDLFIAHSQGLTQRSGQFEFGYFNRFGVGTANVLSDNSAGIARVRRLDSTWIADYPEKLQTLHLGDTINAPGSWGRSVRFGGIQWGTNFGTQPGFVTFPPQRAAGQAVLPSTVDVFINNALVLRQRVPPGPFLISNLPVITGAGEVQLWVRDMSGREQLVIQPFYASQTLLREGLKSFSAELGFVRENFGINSNDYGSGLGVGTYRRGLSERFTGEIHAEAMRNQAAVGVGGDYLITQLGTLNIYAAGSRSHSNHGGMLLMGMERQAQPWSLGARTQWASSGFTQVGLQASQLAPAQVSSFNLSYAAHSGGSVGIAYARQLNRDQTDSRIAAMSYSVTLGKIGTFGISAVRNLTGVTHTAVFALLSMSLSSSTSVSVSAQSLRDGNASNSNHLTTTLQRNLPIGEGYGYRLQARTDGSREASYSLQNNVGSYTLDASQNQGLTATRLNVSGGVALFGEGVFFGRRIEQSFAVVNISDYPNVRILADNQPAGRSNANGNALIPRLRAYDRNVIAIDQRDLPLEAKIGTLKLDAVPYFRSGIEIKFPIKHSRGATFTIHLEDGKPLPTGASVQKIGEDEVYTVGYDGEVYIVGLDSTTRLRATWNSQSCEFVVRFTESADPLPDLGIFLCPGIKP